MSWQYYTTDSHTLKEKTSAWAPNANKVLTRVPIVSTQNVPRLEKVNSKVTAKTTLERNWYFLPKRDLSIKI